MYFILNGSGKSVKIHYKEEYKHNITLYVLNSALATSCRNVGLTFFFFNKHKVCSAGGSSQAAARGWDKMRSQVMFQQTEINPYLTEALYLIAGIALRKYCEWIRWQVNKFGLP